MQTLILSSFVSAFHKFEKDHCVSFVLCFCTHISQGISSEGPVLSQEDRKWVKHEELKNLQREDGFGLGTSLINIWEGEGV